MEVRGMFKVNIREASEGDKQQIRAIMSMATKQLRTVYKPRAKQLAKSSAPQIRWLLAEVGERAVGALRYWREENRFHLGLGVVPEFQRRGVGRALLERLSTMAGAAGVVKLALHTVIQTGNVAIFERWGFVVKHVEQARRVESPRGEHLEEAYMEFAVRHPVPPPRSTS